MIPPCHFRQPSRTTRGSHAQECTVGANFRSVGPDMHLCQICPVPSLTMPFDCEDLLLYTRLQGSAAHLYIDVTFSCERIKSGNAESWQARPRCSQCPTTNGNIDLTRSPSPSPSPSFCSGETP